MSEGTVAEVLAGSALWCVVHGEGVSVGERPEGAEWGERNVLASIPDDAIDIMATDPPYSAHVHKSVRSAKRNDLPDVAAFKCRTRRTVDLGFEHLSAKARRENARQAARLVKRWSMFFCDAESTWLWRLSLTACGLKYLKTMQWIREGGAPNFTGMGPAACAESIVLAHRPGRTAWNGGGKSGLYAFPIVANRAGQRGSRLNETQKPEPLMVALLRDFSEPGHVVIDQHNGSGTTGAAALRLGCRYIGIERRLEQVEKSRARLRALNLSATLHAGRANRMRQADLFGKPAPCLDPDKMHGAGDQQGGSDY